MKYFKYTLMLATFFAIIGVSSSFAKTYFYSNVSLPINSNVWTTPEARQKRDEYSIQTFKNNGARDILNSVFALDARTKLDSSPYTTTNWVTAQSGGNAVSLGSENKAVAYYYLQLKTARYNALNVSFSGEWKIDDQN